VKGVWVEGNSLPISDRIPRVDIRWWQGFLSQNMHGAAISDGNRPASKLSAKKIDEDRVLMKSL